MDGAEQWRLDELGRWRYGPRMSAELREALFGEDA
jgi:hypothetical protein